MSGQEETKETVSSVVQSAIEGTVEEKDYAEFEIGQHQVPWFLWIFFALIISWASISWIKFFGY